jgi:hypothetical protein
VTRASHMRAARHRATLPQGPNFEATMMFAMTQISHSAGKEPDSRKLSKRLPPTALTLNARSVMVRLAFQTRGAQ